MEINKEIKYEITLNNEEFNVLMNALHMQRNYYSDKPHDSLIMEVFIKFKKAMEEI